MPLRVRKATPYFRGQAVIDGKIKEISLHDYRGQYLVLLFYPMDFTYVSPTEILAFSDRAKEFYRCNCSIVGISTDSEFTHLAWMKLPREEGGLGGVINIALLSDKSMKISRDYGVLDRDTGISHRGLYIIDTRSILRHITMNDLEVGRSVDETLRLVKAFQFTDKYIKVCPVDWKPGDRGLRPDPMQTGRYFEGYFGVSKSNVQIKDGHPEEEKRFVERPIKEEGVVGSHSAPSNSIHLLPESPIIDKENASSMESSILNSTKATLGLDHETKMKMYRREFNIDSVDDSLNSSMNYGQIDTRSYPTNTKGVKNNDYENLKQNRTNRNENRSYKIYSTALPKNVYSKLEQQQKNLPANIQTMSKSDTTRKYNYQTSQQTPNSDFDSNNNNLRNEPQNTKAYLQESHLKPYIYNDHDESYNLDADTDVQVLKDNFSSKPERYEFNNDEVYTYNERVTKENEVLVSKQGNQNRIESGSINKTIRKSKPGENEIENVKDVNYHPLNDVLNVQSLRTYNNIPIIENRVNVQRPNKPNPKKYFEKPQKLASNQFDEYDEVQRYLFKNNERNHGKPQVKVQKYIPKQNPTKGQSNNITSLSSKEDFEPRKYNTKAPSNQRPYAASLNETLLTNQRQQDRMYQRNASKHLQSSSQILLESGGGSTAPTKEVKANLRRPGGNVNNNSEVHTIKEETQRQGIRNLKHQYTTDVYAKGRIEVPKNKTASEMVSILPKNVKELKHELNYGMNGHLIM